MGGRYFLHAHPSGATSWNQNCINSLLRQPGVQRINNDQGQFGQESVAGELVKKPTGWMSNCPGILKQLHIRCLGRGGECSRRKGGRHVTCSGRVARDAAIYPFALCKAILSSLKNQLLFDGRLEKSACGMLESFYAIDDHKVEQLCAEMFGLDSMSTSQCCERNVNNISTGSGSRTQQGQETFRDSVTGQVLDPTLVRSARRKEMECFKSKNVWIKKPVSEACEGMGKAPITAKWVDTNKGDDVEPNYRSRLVAREIRRHGGDSIFSPTPPLESLRTILSLAVTSFSKDKPGFLGVDRKDRGCNIVNSSRCKSRSKGDSGSSGGGASFSGNSSVCNSSGSTCASTSAGTGISTSTSISQTRVSDWRESEDRIQISLIDISRAYFHAKADDEHPTYVQLPAGDPDSAKGLCGHLQVHMYGTRRAAQGWHDDYSVVLEELGFRRGISSTCVFFHIERILRTSVHGDDFTSSGGKRDFDWFKEELSKRYELKEEARLGPGRNDDKEGEVLNRIIRWTEEGVEYEADPRQGEKFVVGLNLEGCKGVFTPGVRISPDKIMTDQELATQKHKLFRALAARANYLAADRPEIQFAAKEICRWMSKPSVGGVAAMKRLGRFLQSQIRLVYKYPFQNASCVDVYSDTDWAGCAKTRKSTSGGCVMLGSHLIKSWSSTQLSVSLSSAEAEFYGVVKASSYALGYKSLLDDLGIQSRVREWTNLSATLGICNRSGLGKLRHVDTHCL